VRLGIYRLASKPHCSSEFIMAGKGIRSLSSNLQRLAGNPISIVRVRGRCVVATNVPLVDLNTADAQTLMTLPGIAKARAADIIAARQASPLSSVGDLKKIIPSLSAVAFAKCADACTTLAGFREVSLDEANAAHKRAVSDIKTMEASIVKARAEALTTMVKIRDLVNSTRGRGHAQANYTGVGPDTYRPLCLPRLTFERHGKLHFRYDFDQRVEDARKELEG
jgi:hypothetical protein